MAPTGRTLARTSSGSPSVSAVDAAGHAATMAVETA